MTLADIKARAEKADQTVYQSWGKDLISADSDIEWLIARVEALEAENERLQKLVVRLGEWGKKALRKETAAALRDELAGECAFFTALAEAEEK